MESNCKNRFVVAFYCDYYPSGLERDISSLHERESDAILALKEQVANHCRQDNMYVFDWEEQKKINVDVSGQLASIVFADFNEDGQLGQSGVESVVGKNEPQLLLLGTRKGGFLRFRARVPEFIEIGKYCPGHAIEYLRIKAVNHFESGRIKAKDGRCFDQVSIWGWAGKGVRINLCEAGKRPGMYLGEMTSQVDVPLPHTIDRNDTEAVQRHVAEYLGIEQWDKVIVYS